MQPTMVTFVMSLITAPRSKKRRSTENPQNLFQPAKKTLLAFLSTNNFKLSLVPGFVICQYFKRTMYRYCFVPDSFIIFRKVISAHYIALAAFSLVVLNLKRNEMVNKE